MAALDYRNPKTRRNWVADPPQLPKFMNTETVPEICHDDRRPVRGEHRGFGAVLDRHPSNYGRRYYNTTYRDNYGRGMRKRVMESRDPVDMAESGISVMRVAERPQGIACSALVGETFKPDSDPADNTFVQRSWMYTADPALTALTRRAKSARPSVPTKNNELSLPLGEGAHKAMMSQTPRGTKSFRVTTEITVGRGSRYGVSIWADD
mmetsp:Transcript_12980/g.29311  ORF Transcript_12980/g.29311 Transcript_12980/m.29311 type:complete len:208 (+) Transcript_12980:315-938(+)